MINTKPVRTKKIRKGDLVMAIAGNNRGMTGTVLKCTGNKAVVQGLNVRKRHVKPSQAMPKGDIISIEKPIDVSNLRVCAAEDKPVKLKVAVNKKGDRHFVYENDGKEVVYRSVKKPKE